MKTKEQLLKKLYDLYLIIYKRKMCEERQALIAAQFRLEDFVNEVKRYTRDISEEYAMQHLIVEIEDMEKAVNGY